MYTKVNLISHFILDLHATNTHKDGQKLSYHLHNAAR